MGEETRELHEVLTSIQTELEEIRKARTSAAWKWWVGVLVPLLTAAIISAHATIWHLSNRVSTLEQSAFTEADALRMEATIVDRITALPQMIERLNDHEERIRQLEAKRQ